MQAPQSPMIKRQVKQNQKAANETVRIRKLFLLAFVLNLVLALLKGALAMESRSLAVTASAIDSITDSVASLVVFGGILLADRTTRTFPLGLYKIENVLSILLALFIFLTGYEIAKRAFLAPPGSPTITLPVVLLLLAATVAILLFGRYALSLGRETGSPTLIAEGKHRQADVLANGLVLLASVLHYLQLHHPILGLTVDQWAAVLVLLFIMHTGWELLSDGMRVLLDASIDKSTLDAIEKIIQRQPGVTGINSLIGRSAGRFRFIQADIAVRTSNLEKAHAISHRIEQEIKKSIPNIQRVSIHYEPFTPERLRFALPLQDQDGRLSEHFGSAPYFALADYRIKGQSIGSKEILSNPYLNLERGKGIEVAEWLVRQHVDRLVLKKPFEHKGPEYVFNDAAVEIETTKSDTIDSVQFPEFASRLDA
ncbi:MAG: cation diffusion facilitator family transporter [Desulfovibrionales bacterium]